MSEIQEEIYQVTNLLPITQPVSISWHNIQVFSKVSKRFYDFRKNAVTTKEIIRKVSGEVKAGQLLAIMGASGAGKTTLLNVLTSRNLSQVRVKGEVRLNGWVADNKTLTSLSVYVQQIDLFLPILTVREHLIFQSLLKMDQNCAKEERSERIEQLLNDFSLIKCADNRIGSSSTFKGISGGEAKRLAFASELFTNPSIMFCDEPTSGLDSYMAESIVNVLKKMSSQGRTIICTIHQPSSQVFQLFEQLLLLADGRVAYMGAINDGIDFFGSLGYNCPTNFNPSDFFIEQLAVIPGQEMECKEKINNICDKYLESIFGQNMNCLLIDETEDNLKVDTNYKPNTLTYKTDFFHQLSTIFYRSFLTTIREPEIARIRLSQSFVIALILGFVYWQQDLDQRGVMNLNGALFLLVTNMTFSNSLAVINTFCAEISLFLREHHNGMYRVDVYFLSKMFAEFPVFIAIPIINVGTYYYMVGFNSEFGHFLVAVLIGIMVIQCAVSFGYLMSCISTSATMAASLCGPMLLPLILFGGFLLNSESVPEFLIYLKYISWFYYGFEALIINQWSDIDYIECPDAMPNSTLPLMHCWNTGKDVIKLFDFDENNLLRNIFMLFVLIIVIRILAFIALYFKSKKR